MDIFGYNVTLHDDVTVRLTSSFVVLDDGYSLAVISNSTFPEFLGMLLSTNFIIDWKRL